MKICLYSENKKLLAKSGTGRAVTHQKQIFLIAKIKTTFNYQDRYDAIVINTYGFKTKKVIKHARAQGAKVFYYAHSTKEDFVNSFLFSNWLAPFFKWWIKRLYSLADHIIVSSDHNYKILRSYGLKNPITIISNGINPVKYQNNQDQIAQFRKHFQIKPHQKVVVGGGLLIARKGLADFIQLAADFPNHQFIWFGATSWWMRQIKTNWLLWKARKKQNLIFPGFIESGVFQGALAGADCFLFPSHEEGEGIIILEALACNQIALVRDIGAYQNWLVDHKNCYKANNYSQFKGQLQNILHQKNKPLTKSPQSVAYLKSFTNIASQWLLFFQKVNW